MEQGEQKSGWGNGTRFLWNFFLTSLHIFVASAYDSLIPAGSLLFIKHPMEPGWIPELFCSRNTAEIKETGLNMGHSYDSVELGFV